jgi:hypothetical protein
MRELKVINAVAEPMGADVIARVLKERGVPHEVYDFIAHNLGKGAALAAVLVGEYKPPTPPDGPCRCG